MNASQRLAPSRDRYGLTLFELVIALALSALIMVAIGMAIDLHLRTLDTRRNQVEESQLARAVLRLIAEDLRNAVQYKAIDFSSVEELAGAGMGDTSGLDDASGDMGEVPADDTGGEVPAEEGTEDIATSIAPPTIPGLYGNQYELQVDVSRLPRVDQYDPTLGADGVSITDIPSDVKTVSYYLLSDTSGETTSAAISDTMGIATSTTGSTGLVRRQLDRAVTKWAEVNGDYGLVDTVGETIAPEVVWLEFAYFDGTEWLLEWDSDEIGGLPLAVEIVIGIAPATSTAQTSVTGMLTETSATDEEMSVYRLVVHLPVSEIVEEEEMSEDEMSAEEMEPAL